MRLGIASIGLSLLLAAPAALAAEPSFAIAIKDQQFTPTELEVPAGVKVKVVIPNDDKAPAEFESSKLRREKIVPRGGPVVLFVGPLAPGSFEFYNDLHPTSRGRLIAK